MDRDHILALLRQHQAELHAAGLLHLRVFGSVARGQATPSSDVDLLAEFDTSRRMTLVSVGGLESRLCELLGAKVDLSTAAWMRAGIHERAMREAVLAF